MVKWISQIVDTTGDGIIGPGDTLTYSFRVKNTGNVALSSVVINDSKLGITNSACVASLAVGASATCSFTKTYVITEADLLAGGVVNTATATGTPPSGLGLTNTTDVSDTGTAPTTPGVVTTVSTPETVDTPIPSTVYTSVTNSSALGDDPTVLTLQTPVASLVLLKSITNVVDTTGNGLIGVGDTVTYTFKVTNTGNVTLAPVTITDEKLGLTNWSCLATLAPGQTANCTSTANYIIQTVDVQNQGIVNTATATGTPPTRPAGAPVIPPATDVLTPGPTDDAGARKHGDQPGHQRDHDSDQHHDHGDQQPDRPDERPDRPLAGALHVAAHRWRRGEPLHLGRRVDRRGRTGLVAPRPAPPPRRLTDNALRRRRAAYQGERQGMPRVGPCPRAARPVLGPEITGECELFRNASSPTRGWSATPRCMPRDAFR